MGLPAILNGSLNTTLPVTTHVVTTTAHHSSSISPIFNLIILGLVIYVIYRIVKSYLQKPKWPKLRPVGKIIRQQLDDNNRFGGERPTNAVLELSDKDRYKILFIDRNYKITPIKTVQDKKTKTYSIKVDLKAKPLECYYMRVKPLDPIRQLFSSFVKEQIFIIPQKDLVAQVSRFGELISLTAKKFLYFDTHGSIHYDREYPEIRYKLTQDTLYKEHWESQESSYDRASRIAVMINSPYMAGQAQLNKEGYEGQAKVERSKRSRDYE